MDLVSFIPEDRKAAPCRIGILILQFFSLQQNQRRRVRAKKSKEVPAQITVIAIGAYMVQQWHGPPWNAPIWPLLPLILNRSIEAAALSLNNVFTSITVAHCPQV